MYLKSRNPLLTFLLSYHVWVTSKIQVNFRFDRYWWYCLINFWNFHTIHVFEVRESNAYISTELPCLSNLENLGQFPVQGYLEGTDDCIMDFHNFFIIYVFEVKESIVDIHTELRCLIDLKNPSQLPVWEVLVILSHNFLKFSHCSCFWGQENHCWYFYIATMFRWPRKSRTTSGPGRTRGYWWLCLVDFWNFSTIYVFEVRESFNDLPTELPCLRDLKNSSCYVMPRHATSCHLMSRHVTSCHVMPRHVASCHVRPCHVMSCHVMPRHVTSKVAGLSHDQRFFVNWLLPHAVNSS